MSNRTIKFLEKKDIEKILDTIKQDEPRGVRDYALIQVLFVTGLRISECINLKRVDFAFVSTGSKHSNNDDPFQLSIVGKNQKQRLVFFNAESLAAIQLWLKVRQDDDARLFPIHSRWAQYMITRRAIDAGFEAWVHPHTFRHSFATHVLRKGACMRIFQTLLGHSDISTTMIYAGVADPDLLEAHKKYMN